MVEPELVDVASVMEVASAVGGFNGVYEANIHAWLSSSLAMMQAVELADREV